MLKRLFWNENQHRLRAPWRLAVQAALMAVFALAPVVVLTEVVAAAKKRGALPPAFSGAVGEKIIDLIVGPLFTILVVVSIWIAGRWLDHRRFADFGFHLGRNWVIDLAFGFGLGGVLIGLIFLVEWAAGWIVVEGTFQVNMPGLSWNLAVVYVFVKDICVAVYEGLLSVGYHLKNIAEGFNGLRGLKAKLAIILAALASSVIFGILHVSNPQASPFSTVALILNGVLLALAYVFTGELAIPMGLHWSWNLFQGAIFGFPVSGDQENANVIAIHQGGPTWVTGGAFGPEAGVIGIAAMLVGCLLVPMYARWRYGRLGIHEPLAVGPRP